MAIHPSGVTIKEAARLVGVSEAAVRQRLLRGTLSSTRQNGRVFVLLPEDTDLKPLDDTASRPDDMPDDTDERVDTTASPSVIAQLRSENALIREQLIIKDRQISELHVMLQTAQRQLPASVPAAREARERPAMSTEADMPVQSPDVIPEGAERADQVPEKPQRWPWWMRLLAGK